MVANHGQSCTNRRISDSKTPPLKQQRSIASFFSPKPSPSPPSLSKQKPLLLVSSSSPSPKPPPLTILDDAPLPYTPSVEPSPHLDPSHPAALIGRRLRIYWPLDDAWYSGCVKSYEDPLHRILYDDGDEEAVCLQKEKLEWLPSETTVPSEKRGNRRKLRKLSIIKASSVADTVVSMQSSIGAGQSDKKRVRRGTSGRSSGSDNIHREAQRMDIDSVEDDDDVSSGGDESDDEADSDDGEWVAKEEASTESSDDAAEGLVSDDEMTDRPAKKPKIEKGRPLSKKARKSSPEQMSLRPNMPSNGTKHGLNGSIPSNALKEELVPKNNNTVFSESSRSVDNGNKPIEGGSSALMADLNIHLTGEAAERFGGRVSKKFSFLEKNRKDACGKCPGDPGYNPRTLYLPPEFLKDLSAGQRQWWEFKSKHMDKVLLFKMGKFYEMFEMDAHVGAQHLDLQYMKGDQPHCGFPERNFEENAGKLARLGFRVVVIEQVETPEQRELRNIKSGTRDKVVKRDICAVITRGTITDGDMLLSAPDAAYLMTIFELQNKEAVDVISTIGLCFLDAATSRFIIGQFVDDKARSHLRSILCELRPVEIVLPTGMLSSETERALNEQTRNALVTKLTPGLEFWDSRTTIHEVTSFFRQNMERVRKKSADMNETEYQFLMPEFLRSLFHAECNGETAIRALGGCISYLRQMLLDQRMLNSSRFGILPGSDPFLELQKGNSNTLDVFADEPKNFMLLDSSALENLEILENNYDGGTSGTLLAQLDHCVTAFGRRLLKQWIVRPLLDPDSIRERQCSVEDIKGMPAEVVSKFRKDLLKIPDMERLVVCLKACSERSGRNAQGVVLYEDAARKLLKEFLAALNGFQIIVQNLSSFSQISNQFESERLRFLLAPGKGMVNIASTLKYFEDAFDWNEAEREGRITPHEGVDSDFDMGSANVRAIERKLEAYLKEQQEFFKSQSVVFVTVGKDRFQLEVPESAQKRVPSDYELVSSRKGFKRYCTQPVRDLVQAITIEEERKEEALKNIIHSLLARFCENYASWLSIVRLVAELDALISLFTASSCIVGASCKPIICSSVDNSSPLLIAKSLRHPILENNLDAGRCFVPNDISLGGVNHAPLMLLTGPNMGGKSTLLRQVCLAIILAQVGACVPAIEFWFSPVDRVFVRMGAKDNIMSAQSTFLVELLETASMLTCATRNSLVALDELGRGTATSDGQAIAHAVLEHLARNVRCIGMFSTHYHRLAADHADDPMIALHHMACKVESIDGIERVTFLYTLAAGICPKSYGVNVARIAGMPERVLKRAAARSAEMENGANEKYLKAHEEKLFVETIHLANKLVSPDQQDMTAFPRIRELWRTMKLKPLQ